MNSLGIPCKLLTSSPWCGDVDFQGSERARSLIDGVVWHKLGVQAAKMDHVQKACALEHVYVDISQNHVRRPFTNASGITGTLTTSTMLYSFGRQGFILPYELLLFHGHSRTLRVPEAVSSSNLKALAGEGMSLPCVGSILWAGLLVRDQ